MIDKRKIVSFFAAAVMTAGIFPVVPAEAEETVSILSVSDFKEFTEKCVYDEYSKNKKFVLEADLDLKGVEIKNAEVFCGYFEGGGHSITNVTLSFEGSNKGLFASVTKEGSIHDLNVTGTIKVSEEKNSGESDLKKRAAALLSRVNITSENLDDGAKAAGGIVGYNEGKIVNCSFDGEITGKRQAGGIAGFNGVTGIIDSCANGGSITGKNETGGIAGYNEGRIKNSKNTGTVCPNADEDTVNAGGICGNSEGAVVMCTNEGAVGGKSFGDNVGGICGKQSGEIRECVNNGTVRGRRSVGGICGRFEPYTDIELSYESAKNAIEKQIDTLNEDLDNARNRIVDFAKDLLDGDGIISEVLERLGLKEQNGSSRLDKLSDRLDKLTESATGMMDSISDAADEVSDLSSISDDVSDVAKSLKDVNGKLGSTIDKVNDSNLTGKLSDSLESVSSLSDEAKTSIKTVSDSLEDSLVNLDEFLDEFDGKGQEISDTIKKLNDAIDSGQEDVDELRDRLFSDADELKEDIDTLSDKLDTTHDNLQSALRSLRNAGSGAYEIFDDLDDSVINTRRELQNIRDSIDNTLRPFRNIKSRISDRIDKIRSSPSPSPSASPEAEEDTESVQGYKADTDAELEGTYEVEPSVIGYIEGLLFPTAYAEKDDDKIALSDLVSIDISMPRLIGDENADTALIKYCINNADVEGTEMAGGISGCMGFESILREGENMTLPDGTKVNADSLLKAVIDSCVSDANVTVKDEYAGGGVGKCDIGNIKNVLTSGEIKVTDGSYSGGTAGFTLGDIKNCIAVNDIEGSSYIGGIAGSGKDIKNSYSLARLDGKKDKSGAVAGFSSGEIEDTYFIDEGLSGISGANLEGRAEPVAPSEIASDDGNFPVGMPALDDDGFCMESGGLFMPQIKTLRENEAQSAGTLFRSKSSELASFRFRVRFVDRGKELQAMTVDYGTVLDTGDIPRLTADGTEVPAWDKNISEPIVRRTTFTAEYNKATTTISTGEEPPLLLVESVFDDDTEVELRDENAERDFSGYERGSAYSFTLSKNAYDVIKVHIRDESKNAEKIAVMENGKWTLIDCEVDGSYAVFTVGAPCKFVVLHRESSAMPVIFIAAAMTAAGAAGIIIFCKVRRRKKDGNKERNEEKKDL